MEIHGRGESFAVKVKATVKGVEKELSLPYKLNQTLRYRGLDGDSFESTPSWRGNTLSFKVKEREGRAVIFAAERWNLDEATGRLTVRKQERGGGEHSDCTFTFEKQTQARADANPVTIRMEHDRIAVDIRNQPFTNFYMGAEARKPFLYPLRSASGKKVSRGYPVEPLPGDPTDHPHQKGLWVGAEHLSGMDFWENDPSYKRPNMGRIMFKDVLSKSEDSHSGSFTLLADWISLEGTPVLRETRKMTFYSEPADCRIFDVELALKARIRLTFEDHHDAVIGMRLGPAFDEKNGGRAVNAQGLEGESGVRGRRSEWVDWRADVEGEKLGVALMDHPGNYSFPTRWHVRSMGLLVASPFAQHAYSPTDPDGSRTLDDGEELHLRYRVVIHPAEKEISNLYREFADQ